MYFDLANPMKYTAQQLDFNYAIQLVEYNVDQTT